MIVPSHHFYRELFLKLSVRHLFRLKPKKLPKRVTHLPTVTFTFETECVSLNCEFSTNSKHQYSSIGTKLSTNDSMT